MKERSDNKIKAPGTKAKGAEFFSQRDGSNSAKLHANANQDQSLGVVVKRALFVCLLGAAASALAGGAVLGVRQAQKTLGGGIYVPTPNLASAYNDEVNASQASFAADLTYTSLDVKGNGEVTSHVEWNDDWFTADPTSYNHSLAHTASVLSALAYSESGYYQAGSKQPPYMENALAKLGFVNVSTESYRYRSEVVDEVLNVVTNDSDSIAYTIARRHLRTSDGTKRDLIVVSARGSYGSEWLSNLNLDQSASQNHSGYHHAAQEICDEIATWTEDSKDDGAEVSVLLVGHSRGGAVVNIAAAQLANTERVYTYTFASPATTLSSDARSSSYASIFNIVNPSDIMPSLPLKAWGYERYGVDLMLPGVGEADFNELDQKMRASYKQAAGIECSYDPTDRETVQTVVDEVGASIKSVDELVTPQGAATVFSAITAHVDPIRILYSHYPTTYIAWLDVTPAERMTVVGIDK